MGEKASLSLTLPEKLLDKLDIDVLGSSRSVFSAPQEQSVAINRDGSSYDILALQPGRADVQLKLFGYIPLKSIQVESLPPRRVVVGGHSIGVLLKSRGYGGGLCSRCGRMEKIIRQRTRYRAAI